jgi:hypothetical protein
MEHFKEEYETASELPSHLHQENTKNQMESGQRTVNKELMSKKPLLHYPKHRSIH